MGFNVSAFLYTIGCCLISVVIAGKSGNDKDKEWFANLNHPDHSFLLKIMNIVGVVFYMLFGFVLYHLFVSRDAVSIVLMIAVIQLMGLSPYFMYKTKNLTFFFYTMLIFPVLVPVLIFLLLQINIILAMPIILYALWLIYDMSYFYRLMKLNEINGSFTEKKR